MALGTPFNDGEHILYVNGEYRDNSEIGWLMHDFNCADPADMHYALMSERTRYLKEHPEGVREMCKIMEEMVDEALKEDRLEIAKRLLLEGSISIKAISNICKLPLADVEILAQAAKT